MSISIEDKVKLGFLLIKRHELGGDWRSKIDLDDIDTSDSTKTIFAMLFGSQENGEREFSRIYEPYGADFVNFGFGVDDGSMTSVWKSVIHEDDVKRLDPRIHDMAKYYGFDIEWCTGRKFWKVISEEYDFYWYGDQTWEDFMEELKDVFIQYGKDYYQ